MGRTRQMKTALWIALRTLQIFFLGMIGGVSIQPSFAADDFAACQQSWARALIDIRSSGTEPHDYETWGPIGQIATYCPHHPELIETLFTVLNDETRREDWDQAMQWIAQAVHYGVKLSKPQVESLVKILPKLPVYHRDGCLSLLGGQKDNAEIAITAVRPYLANEKATLSTIAAAAVLRLSPTDPEAQKVLLNVATSQTIKDRRCATRRMGRSGVDTPQFREALRVAMKDADSGVRVLSACSLWEITKSADESLPVLKVSLADESVQIDCNTVMYPSATYPSQHLSTINCLGEMAITEPGAKQLLEDIAMKRIAVGDEWPQISQTLISAHGKVKYGEMSFEEAAIRTALADDGVFSEIAKQRFSKRTTVELEETLKLFEAFRKQEALWSEASQLP